MKLINSKNNKISHFFTYLKPNQYICRWSPYRSTMRFHTSTRSLLHLKPKFSTARFPANSLSSFSDQTIAFRHQPSPSQGSSLRSLHRAILGCANPCPLIAPLTLISLFRWGAPWMTSFFVFSGRLLLLAVHHPDPLAPAGPRTPRQIWTLVLCRPLATSPLSWSSRSTLRQIWQHGPCPDEPLAWRPPSSTKRPASGFLSRVSACRASKLVHC